MTGDAKFSPCGRWRWWLTRVWDESLPMAALIGMNPSTANATDNDPTVHKEIHFVKSWGFGGLLKLNAYGFKATKPARDKLALITKYDFGKYLEADPHFPGSQRFVEAGFHNGITGESNLTPED